MKIVSCIVGYYPYPSTPLEAWGMDISHLVPSKQKRPDIGLQGFPAFFKSADFGIVCWLWISGETVEASSYVQTD